LVSPAGFEPATY